MCFDSESFLPDMKSLNGIYIIIVLLYSVVVNLIILLSSSLIVNETTAIDVCNVIEFIISCFFIVIKKWMTVYS